jgi:hypothetical protein
LGSGDIIGISPMSCQVSRVFLKIGLDLFC